ncbi:MAG: helix-turn-helix domain-containing protein [Betaproteobacteria bacterium]
MTNRHRPQRVATPTQLLSTVAARRRALKLSQEQLAAKLGIHQTHLARLESGRRSLDIDRLLQLLNALGLDLLIQERPPRPAKVEW